jgi:hypothetical protein
LTATFGYLQRSVVKSCDLGAPTSPDRSSLAHAGRVGHGEPEIDETWAAESALPARERAVVVLRYWQDLSEADIASSLDGHSGCLATSTENGSLRLAVELDDHTSLNVTAHSLTRAEFLHDVSSITFVDEATWTDR